MADASTRLVGSFAEPAWLGSFPYDHVLRDEHGLLSIPLGQQLRPSLRLATYSEAALGVLGNWDGRPRPGWETLVFEMTVRGRHLLEATLRLLRCGYAAPALAPARALFELMMNTYWVYEHRSTPGRLLTNLLEHRRYHDRKLRSELDRLPNYRGPVPDVPPFADKKEAEAGRRQWGTSVTGESVFARIERWTDAEHLDLAPEASPDAEPFFPEDEPGQLARMYTEWVSKANLSVHGGMDDYYDRTTTEATLTSGNVLHSFTHSTAYPSLWMLGVALTLAHWSYDRMVRLTFRHADADLDLLDTLRAAHERGQRRVTSAVIEKAARNAPCPCGAPLPGGGVPKAKHCHGAASLSVDEVAAALAVAEWAALPVWTPDGKL